MVLGNVTWDKVNKRIIYKGFDGRLQFANRISNTNWGHGFYDDYWNTPRFSMFGIDDWVAAFVSPSISAAADEKIFYRRKSGLLGYFDWKSCEIRNPEYDSDWPVTNFISTPSVQVKDLYQDVDFSISPNPSSGETINIKITGIAGVKNGILFHVYDQMGKRLLSQTVNATSFDLNCFDFPKGIYSIQLVWADGVKVKQILIN